jgi:Trypsin-like peptidase domain
MMLRKSGRKRGGPPEEFAASAEAVPIPESITATKDSAPGQLSGTASPSNISPVKKLPTKLSTTLTGLNNKNHALLLKKRRLLQTHPIAIPNGLATTLKPAVDATLVFAQEEAGTAVCISERGYLITCAHCIAESADELDESKRHWLVFASGAAVEAECVAWDAPRDLALLRIVAAQMDAMPADTHVFPHIVPAVRAPQRNTALACIGHPGSEDLQASVAGIKTNFSVLHVSAGRFRGYAPGQDLQDNSEIGVLMHNCWTYWGHSGAPIVETAGTGALVGLHSSWDDRTGVRRGVPLEAIVEFLERHRAILEQ